MSEKSPPSIVDATADDFQTTAQSSYAIVTGIHAAGCGVSARSRHYCYARDPDSMARPLVDVVYELELQLKLLKRDHQKGLLVEHT